MSIRICDNDKCTGCGVCADVCPHGAVRIVPDECGFSHPEINDNCVECGACLKMCPVNSATKSDERALFAAYAKDRRIREKSSSGGLFRLLADSIISDGGAVAAVGYDSSFGAVYKIARCEDELDELMGSKYTEASSDAVYGKIKKLLDGGTKVLFVGTPCRVAAAKNFLGRYDGLLTVDFICHGVPSPLLTEKFLSENFHGVRALSYRDKTHGWQEFSMKVSSDGKDYVKSLYKDPYLRTFLGNSFLRSSCYECRFRGSSYASDITLGDFWGISSCIPSMNDDRGTSAVIIRTEKGAAAFDGIRERLIIKEAPIMSLRRTNTALDKSVARPAGREAALDMLKRGATFSEIAEKYGRPIPAKEIAILRAKRTVKKILGKIKK